MILTFLSGLVFVDTLLPLRKLPNKVDIKLFEEEFEGWLSCWFELVDVGSAEEGRDEGQMLCFNCCNLDVFRDVILCEPEFMWEFEWFLICMGVVFGGLYELKYSLNVPELPITRSFDKICYNPFGCKEYLGGVKSI